jgi:chromosomal replication initiation ATPase DnaA
MNHTQIAEQLIRSNPNATVLDLYKAINPESKRDERKQTKSQSSVLAAVGFLLDKKKKIRMAAADHTFQRICQEIEKEIGTNPKECFNKSRKTKTVEIRHLLRYCLSLKTKLTQEEWGIMTGGVDRTTVIHSINAWQDIIDTEKDNREMTNRILARI